MRAQIPAQMESGRRSVFPKGPKYLCLPLNKASEDRRAWPITPPPPYSEAQQDTLVTMTEARDHDWVLKRSLSGVVEVLHVIIG
jgi:hypothetical protein